AVVGGDDDDRLVPEAALLEGLAQRADLLVREGEVAVVEPDEVLALRRRERAATLVDFGDEALVAARRLGDRSVGSELRVERRLGVVGEVRLAEMHVREEAMVLLQLEPGRNGLAEDVAAASEVPEDLVELVEPAVEAEARAGDGVRHEASGA